MWLLSKAQSWQEVGVSTCGVGSCPLHCFPWNPTFYVPSPEEPGGSPVPPTLWPFPHKAAELELTNTFPSKLNCNNTVTGVILLFVLFQTHTKVKRRVFPLPCSHHPASGMVNALPFFTHWMILKLSPSHPTISSVII